MAKTYQAGDNVTIKCADGTTMIGELVTSRKLSETQPGETFDNFIVLEHFPNGTTAVISKDIIEKMQFGVSNNWNKSSIREYLNGKFLKDLEKEFGNDNVVSHKVDLLSLDGLDDYGTTTDRVSLLTIDQYRKYRKLLGSNLDSWWWLATPDSTPSGYGSRCVRCVCSGGGVGWDGCDCGGGVRPFFILKSCTLIS